VHKAVANAISKQLIGSSDNLKVLVRHIASTRSSEESINHLLVKARDEERKIQKGMNNLTLMVERLEADDVEAADELATKLSARGDDLRRRRMEIQRLESLKHDADRAGTSPEQIAAAVEAVAAKLLELGPEASSLIRRLVSKIVAVPCQQFNSAKVVLRAKFELHVCQLLPPQLTALLDGQDPDTVGAMPLSIPMCVDLFEKSKAPEYAMRAFDLKQQNPNMRLIDIGEELKISNRSAHLRTCCYRCVGLQCAVMNAIMRLHRCSDGGALHLGGRSRAAGDLHQPVFAE
jgi:hypothetical protein